MESLVQVGWEDDLVIVTLNDPERMNAFSQDMRDELVRVMTTLSDDTRCRAIVLTGAGQHFSAGANLKGFQETTVREMRKRMQRGGAPLMREMVAGPKPIVAAIEGNAYGAGLALTCACDHVVVSRSAKFCCAFTRVAFMPDMALMFTLPRRVGLARAKQLIALADVIDADRALALGLADELVETGQALAEAKRLARRYADGPPLAFEMVKSVFSLGLDELLKAEIDLQPMPWMSEDHAEGKRAFFEKRRPAFKGR